MRPIASVWGICHRYMIAKSTQASGPMLPRAAAQPATGGNAPGTAPGREQREAEHERLHGEHAAVGQRATTGALHARVEIALEVLVQGQRSTRGERGAEQRVQEPDQRWRALGPEVVAHEGRD